jgi:hypothetical protein
LNEQNDNKLQKRSSMAVVEKGQYALAFVVVAAMLVVAGFPAFVVFFFGIFAYFLWKIFTGGSRSETRDVFEFYLAANEMLRDDDRRWYGFEIREVIARGSRIAESMAAVPPLVYFKLGALYHKIGDFKEAAVNLSNALENERSDEMNVVFAPPELRNYVKVLRKIEREPGEAPMTSAAVRSLERARRLRGRSLLEDSRSKLIHIVHTNELTEGAQPTTGESTDVTPVRTSVVDLPLEQPRIEENNQGRRKKRSKDGAERFSDRKPISEVLHDIYDKGAH